MIPILPLYKISLNIGAAEELRQAGKVFIMI